jgi:hypothetical protein
MTKVSDSTCALPDVTGSTGKDSRTFKELCTQWSTVAGQKQELLLEALVQAFWRGQFERDVRLHPTGNGDILGGYTAITTESLPASASVDHVAGNYALRHDGVVVKIGQDGVSRPTADRTEISVFRDAVARGPDVPNWDGCYEAGAGDRLVPEEVFRDFAAYKLEQWSRTTIEDQYKQWQICRAEFADWYIEWPYAPFASLEQFWPSMEKKA